VTPVADIPLRGAGGEPVDFARTIASHGVAELPPNRLDLEARVLETTLPIPRGARTIRLTERRGKLRIDALAGSIGERARDALTTTVAHMFRFDENLFEFYKLVKEDGELSWCAVGAGRMLRAPTVFEDMVKTNCTAIRRRYEESSARQQDLAGLTSSRQPAQRLCHQELSDRCLGRHRQTPERKLALAGAVFRDELRHPGVSGKRVREQIVGELG